MAAPIDFYFDFASPYGYFASLRIDELAAKHGRTVTWRPILLGAVFKVTGMKPNTHQPLRGDYLVHDVRRIARLMGCPFTYPQAMPVNPLMASRAYWGQFVRDPERAKALARALYRAHWGEGSDIGPIETVLDVAAAASFDRDEVAADVQEPAVKDRLRDETDKAIARGVFGSPFIVVGDEPFWGWDRLDMVDRWLGTGGW
ncbi:MAG TPA: 2-hydroxychromene-2-carboxylate isomerase [Azospirillum sp.]|nr:2-hydroxychromene-2-carboxylate isomerase [Azospirillum sp.]